MEGTSAKPARRARAVAAGVGHFITIWQVRDVVPGHLVLEQVWGLLELFRHDARRFSDTREWPMRDSVDCEGCESAAEVLGLACAVPCQSRTVAIGLCMTR